MVSEQAAVSEWRKLFNSSELSLKKIEAGERLLDELPFESPLRTRLGQELDDLRQLLQSKRK